MDKRFHSLLLVAILSFNCTKVNHGKIFYDENIYNPKRISKPGSCIDIEKKISDSLDVKLFNICYYKISADKYAIRFDDMEDGFDKETMKMKSNEYLIVVDINCDIIKVKKEAPIY